MLNRRAFFRNICGGGVAAAVAAAVSSHTKPAEKFIVVKPYPARRWEDADAHEALMRYVRNDVEMTRQVYWEFAGVEWRGRPKVVPLTGP